jgi:hypothetical protein
MALPGFQGSGRLGVMGDVARLHGDDIRLGGLRAELVLPSGG